MTKLLEHVIAKLLERPAEDQDRAAKMLLAHLGAEDEPEELDAETIAAIEEGLAQIERGEIVTQEEMAEFFRQRGA